MKIIKRTFEALKYPLFSEQRKALNQNWRTSEYYPSKKYGIDNSASLFETKRQAMKFLAEQ